MHFSISTHSDPRPANFTSCQKPAKLRPQLQQSGHWHRVYSMSAVAGGSNCCTPVYKSDQGMARHWRNEDDTDDTPNLSLRSKMELVWLSSTSWSWHYSHIPVPIPYDHPKLPRYTMIDLPSENDYIPWILPLYWTVCLHDSHCPFHNISPLSEWYHQQGQETKSVSSHHCLYHEGCSWQVSINLQAFFFFSRSLLF